ncbi:hypothetical protein [Polyangium sp. 6x1]|uniref:hypothetical protein n=1 Tax=Polyangium sp. 6x1 TaxID=3042689 RepID=UPI002483154D|nr:hypothetical protein [Polyangium sp. 6x1]MDI1451222.1 hypothetical protein [Polyangium sp. 6x1]
MRGAVQAFGVRSTMRPPMRPFSVFNLTDLSVGLADLFTKRHAALTSTKAGVGQEDVLVFQRNAIDALPKALVGGKPMSEELASKDDEHDGFGTGLWHMTEAYFRVQNLPPHIVDAARRIREAFIPTLGALQESYADEAAAANARKEELGKLEADLKLFQIAGGGTLYDWAAVFVAAGQDLSVLLSKRADVNAATRKNAQVLRSETVGILNDLRRAIAREAKRNPALAADIDAQIFGYLDTLEEQRIAAHRASKAERGKSSTNEG